MEGGEPEEEEGEGIQRLPESSEVSGRLIRGAEGGKERTEGVNLLIAAGGNGFHE